MMPANDDETQMNSIKNKLTFDEVVGVAKRITNDDFVRVLDYSLNDYSKDKLGYTACHHILKITVQKSNVDCSPETINAFVKIASLPLPDDFDKNIDVNAMITIRETFFLETLVSQFMDSYKGERWWPMHYYTTKNIIIMEDLKSSGYKLLEEFIDNYTVLKSVLASLARFHSCSILAEARMSQSSKCPTALNEQYKDAFSELMFLRTGEGSTWFSSATKLACALAEYFGYDSTKTSTLFDRVCDMVMPSKIHRNVVCHGDVHFKNLMFADSSPLPKCILIDFQTYRYSPLVIDILQFLHTNATREFREKHEAKLIEFYHSVLTETIKSNDPTKIAEIPTLADISKGIEDLRLFGLVIACIYHPLLFLDPELIKKHARDSEFNKNLLTGDRMELTFAQLKVNEFFKNKIEAAIRELMETST